MTGVQTCALPISSDPNPVHIYNTPGTYHVCLTVTDSCGANTACDDIYMLIPLSPQINITPEATNDLKAQFNDLTPGTTHWMWKFGDGDSSEEKSPSHTYREYGTYKVCLTTGNNQYLGTTCENLLLSVNPALHSGNPVLVYPNPTNGKLFLRFYRVFSSAEVRVSDQYGRLVFFQDISSPNLSSASKIDLSMLTSGVYFVRVKCENYSKVWKIIVF